MFWSQQTEQKIKRNKKFMISKLSHACVIDMVVSIRSKVRAAALEWLGSLAWADWETGNTLFLSWGLGNT